MQTLPAAPDSRESLARDIGAVSRIGAVPSILQMICDETGMGFAAVARVTDATWTACAVHDTVSFGLKAGGQLELKTTLCYESRAARAPIIIDHFSDDATYRGHHTAAVYGLESYISVPIVLPNGDYFGNLCAIDARPAKVSESRVVRMFEVFANLIAMQLDNEQRQWSTEALLTTERETAALREQFIAVLGHDLRNPLSAVSATAELLVRRQSEPELVTAGQRLKRTVARMTRLIDDVMDFARGRLGGGIQLSIQTVDDLSAHLQAVVDELRVANPSRTVMCDISIVSPVRGDLSRIQQLFSNLLGNAVTHGANDLPVNVLVTDDAEHVVIAVTNRGNPIPEDLVAKVFEPYWRPPTSGPGGGLGLGLFICKQMVEAHAGTLEVCSSLEQGTCFTARIPSAQIR
jgi:signal transduction histidine kinase